MMSQNLNAALAVLAFTASVLAGCMSDETASRLLAVPDKYILFSCPELVTAAKANTTRQRELETMMGRAGADVGGQLVSTTAYRPEYAQLRGQMDQIRKTASEKNCRITPGAGGRLSDQVVR